MVEIVCSTCGKIFNKPKCELNPTNNYCSPKCFYNRNKLLVPCEVCGKEFAPRPTALKNGAGRFCSQKCAHESTKKRIKTICPTCGKEFEAIECRVNVGAGKYCSKKCQSFRIPTSDAAKKSIESYRNKEWLVEEYCRKKRSITDIAKELGVSHWTIDHWIAHFNIPIEPRKYNWSEEQRAIRSKWMSENSPSKRPEVRKKISISHMGKNAPNWKGGISFEPYCPKFNRAFKDAIRLKFNYVCYNCNNHETLVDKRCNKVRKLSIHHIDYNKNSICNGHDWAFIPLCAKCHGLSGTNRWHWFNKFIYYWLDKYNCEFDNI